MSLPLAPENRPGFATKKEIHSEPWTNHPVSGAMYISGMVYNSKGVTWIQPPLYKLKGAKAKDIRDWLPKICQKVTSGELKKISPGCGFHPKPVAFYSDPASTKPLLCGGKRAFRSRFFFFAAGFGRAESPPKPFQHTSHAKNIPKKNLQKHSNTRISPWRSAVLIHECLQHFWAKNLQ